MVIEQFIGTFNVPTDGITTIPLTKVAFDIENPAVRKSDFSKSIRIPESKEINEEFEHIFQLDVSLQTFDPNLKTDYLLLGDGITLLKGFCQLNDIIEIDNLRHYVITAKGAIGDLYQSIGEGKLNELDFSSLNHIWNETNIVASWTPTLGQGYVYPMINYGDKISQDSWRVSDFKPALFVREYLDKIITNAGFSWTSTFLDSNRFKSLIVPQSSDIVTLSDSTIQDRQFLVERNATDQTGIDGCRINSPSDGDPLIFNKDTSPFYNTGTTAYNTTTGEWTVATGLGGKYTFKGFLKLNFGLTGLLSQTVIFLQGMVDTLTEAYYNIIIVRERSSVFTVIDVQKIDITADMLGETIATNYTSPDFVGAFTTNDLDIVAGDKITMRIAEVWIRGSLVAALSGAEIQHTLQVDSQCGIVVRDTSLLEGGTMKLNDTIQPEIKQKEFLNAIIKRFNLYLEYDPLDDKNIFIEPLEDFITSDIEDLSEWVDTSKETVIKPLGALKNGKFIFKDQEDEDNENKTYQARKPETYGFKIFDIDNDFLTSEKVIETIFAPTPLWSAVRQNDRIISSIAFPRDVGGFAKESAKIKLLFWGGTKTTNFPWSIFVAAPTIPTLRTVFPYAGHLDDPYNPTFDLNWGVPKILFYDFSAGGLSDLIYTDKNVFNIYWKKHIEEITDKNSKVMEIHLVLNSHRYNTLSFRKQYFINGVHWRLQSVEDFDPINEKTTKCIFIKLKEHDSFSGTDETVYGGSDTFPGGDDFPTYGMMSKDGGGSGRNKANLIYGDNNLSGEQAILNSDDLQIGSGTKQVFVSGSDESKVLGQNSMVVNSPSKETSRPSEAWVNNVYQEQRLDLTMDDTVFKDFNTAPFKVLDDLDADEYYKVTRALIRSNTSGAITSGVALQLRTITTNTVLATTSGTFFDTSNNTEIMTIVEALDFGEGLEFFQVSDMEGGASTTITVTIFYQIIKF